MPVTPRLAALFALTLAACVPQTPSMRQWGDPQALSSRGAAFLTGTWYEVMALPARHQAGCTHSTATYSPPRPDGTMDVVFRCRRNGVLHEDRGVVIPWKPGRLQLKLAGDLFTGELLVLGATPDGRTVYLGTPTRSFGWVLHRDRVFGPEERYAAQVAFGANGYDEAALQRTDQR